MPEAESQSMICLELLAVQGFKSKSFGVAGLDVISVSVADQTKSLDQALSKSGSFHSNMITPEEESLFHLVNFKCVLCFQGSLKFRGVRSDSSPHRIGPGRKEKQRYFCVSRKVTAKFL